MPINDDQMWQPDTKVTRTGAAPEWLAPGEVIGLATAGIAPRLTANNPTAVCDPWPWPPTWQYPPSYQLRPGCTCPSVWLGVVPPPLCPIHTLPPIVVVTDAHTRLADDDVERIARRVAELLRDGGPRP